MLWWSVDRGRTEEASVEEFTKNNSQDATRRRPTTEPTDSSKRGGEVVLFCPLFTAAVAIARFCSLNVLDS